MKTKKLLLGGALIAALGSAAQAEEFRATTWWPTGETLADHFFYDWADRVAKASGGEMTFEIFPGGSLVPAASIAQGVADDVAQVGYHTAAYTPTDMPVSQTLSGMGYVNSDPYVLAFAYADFVMNDPEGYMDWRDDGVVPVGAFSSPVIRLICKDDPIRTLADMDGKRVRLPGGFIASFVQDLGATNVSMPVTETYAAFQYGNIDCTANDATWLLGGGRFIEVADSVTMLDITPLFTSPAHIYNANFWTDRTPEQRRILLDVMAQEMTLTQIDQSIAVDEALEAAHEAGLELIEPDSTLQDARDAWIADGIGGTETVAAETYGIENPGDLVARFTSYLDKWNGLVSGLSDRRDEAEVLALLKENLFDRIDVETYGLE